MKNPYIKFVGSPIQEIVGFNTLLMNFVHEMGAKVIVRARKVDGAVTLTIADSGIGMNHEGMKFSLVSREVIADSIEAVMQGHAYDGLVAFGGCDKTLPGAMMGMVITLAPSLGPTIGGIVAETLGWRALFWVNVVPGLLITLIFGSDALNDFSTSGIFNFFFFALLLVFAASLFGAFEITLPSSWINKADAEASREGRLGIFFMAATFALVSFSCTGPIIGTLLVEAASMGNYLGPAIGMLGFSSALALIFVGFALFPSALKSLPKSGSWLSTIKITLGFLELALVFKFLSNVDLAYHWNWFDREVFLVLWIVTFACLGLYLLGKLRLASDSETKGISSVRLFSALIILAFSLYMVPGLWGAPLKAIAAFLPPQHTQDFDLYTSEVKASSLPNASVPNASMPDSRHIKYSELFTSPHKLPAFFDYGQALAYAKANNNKWSDFQASDYNTNSQPYYVLLSPGEIELATPQGAEYDVELFKAFLYTGLDKFNSLQKASRE